MIDDWDVIFERIVVCYCQNLADQVSDMVDEGKIDEVKLLLKWIGCR